LSPSSFETLANENRPLRREILRLGEWLGEHQGWNMVDLKILSRDLRDLDPARLAIALGTLVDTGAFRRVYKVVTPSGVLAEGDFDDPLCIPERVRDRWGNSFNTADADIVVVFKHGATSSSGHG
jgi:hypothetical protein